MFHTVTEDELGDFVDEAREDWQIFAISSGDGSKKKLEFKIGGVSPIYRVTNHGVVVYIGTLKETAVREYNAAP